MYHSSFASIESGMVHYKNHIDHDDIITKRGENGIIDYLSYRDKTVIIDYISAFIKMISPS